MNSFVPNKDFAFLSNWRSLQTSGKLLALDYLSSSSFAIDSNQLFYSAKQAFATAKQLGQANPIIVGAIPFDACQPACLFVPQQYQFLTKQQLTKNWLPTNTIANNTVQAVTQNFTENQYKNAVKMAVECLRKGELDKVVLAQSQSLTFVENIDAKILFQNLYKQNINSYNYSVPTEQGVFIGSSPELLIQQNQQNIKMLPLAGTAFRDVDKKQDQLNADELLNSSKNLHEHRLVVEDIVKILAKFQLDLTMPNAPGIVSTAKLWHLGTEILAKLHGNDLHVLQLLSALHPTPALCGTPRNLAAEFISQNEPFERGYFAGAVGWCDEQGNGEWAVAIRCAIVQHQQVKLFAGAGIVADSQPQQEWQETQQKLKVMLQALNPDLPTN